MESSFTLLHHDQQDLETYASSYRGLAKLHRLLFVAEHCPPLRVEALRMALTHVMTTYNTNMYQEIHKSLQDAITGYISVARNYCGEDKYPVLSRLQAVHSSGHSSRHRP